MSLNDNQWGRGPDERDERKPQDQDSRDSQGQDGRNEQPRDNQQQDAWGRNAGRRDEAPQPPDLDELWRDLNKKFTDMLGGRAGGQRSNPFGEQNRPGSSAPRDDERQAGFGGFHRQEGGNGPQDGGNGGFGGGDFGRIRERMPRMPQMPGGRSFGFGLGVMLAVALAAWVATGFYIVPEGQAGVVTTFGKYTQTSAPGFRWHMPYPVQDVDLVDVSSVRKTDVGLSGSSQRLKEALMLTDDENIVDLQFNVQYRIKTGTGAKDFLFRSRNPDLSVKQAAESAMREVVGRKTMDSVLFESKQEIAEAVRKLMQEMLDRYSTGIQVMTVAIQNAQPPEQVQAAFNDAVKAGQDRERQINEGQAYANDVVPKATGTASRLRQEAEGYKSRMLETAKGDAERFEKVLKEYEKAPAVTRDRMYVDAVGKILADSKKVMVDAKGSSNLLYLPFDKLLEAGRTEPAAAAPAAVEAPTDASATRAAQSVNPRYTDSVHDARESFRNRIR